MICTSFFIHFHTGSWLVHTNSTIHMYHWWPATLCLYLTPREKVFWIRTVKLNKSLNFNTVCVSSAYRDNVLLILLFTCKDTIHWFMKNNNFLSIRLSFHWIFFSTYKSIVFYFMAIMVCLADFLLMLWILRLSFSEMHFICAPWFILSIICKFALMES